MILNIYTYFYFSVCLFFCVHLDIDLDFRYFEEEKKISFELY